MTPPAADRATAGGPTPLTPAQRAGVAGRYLVLVGVLVGVVGVVGRWLAWPVLASTIGPTAYMFVAHPTEVTSRLRNAVVGHAIALGAGLAALAAFGLWTHPSMSATGSPTWAQVGAALAASGVTLAVLELVGSHHAPAAATALLVSTGLAKPGRPLAGLVVGLAIVIAAGPLLGRTPMARRPTERDQHHDSATESTSP